MTIIPGFRGLRALVAVADQGSVSRAGDELNLSQSAVSRAIQDAEQQLGVSVFERHHAGMVCSALGARMVHRCRRALDQFRRAEETLGQLRSAGHFDRLVQRINERQLAVMQAIAEHHTEQGAARQLQLRQPTISATLRALEDRLNTPLFLRTRRGMVPTLPAYLTIILIMGPAMLRLGLEPLVAHMFVFYFGVASAITPPIAVAAFAAASISKASPLKTSVEATRIGLVIFILPFVFAFYPELLLVSEAGVSDRMVDLLSILLRLTLAIVLVTTAFAGFDKRALSKPASVTRLVLAVAMLITLPWLHWTAYSAD